jgi:hypothetical protein
VSDHNGTMMNTSVRQILEELSVCPIRAAMEAPVAWVTGSPGYQGRHRETGTSSVRAAATRIAIGWDKAFRLTPEAHDLLTGEAFRGIGARIGTTWRTIDRAAYGRLPATWRHRLETSARQRTERAQLIDDTETWWINRRDDYPVLVETQTMPVIRERTPTP